MLYIFFTLGVSIGGLSVFLIFSKKILAEPVLFNGAFKFEDIKRHYMILDDIYSLVASNIDISLYANAVDSAELERQRIGTDIHDELASAMGSIIFDLKLLSGESKSLSIEGQELLLQMHPKMESVILALRNIIYDTMPIALIDRNLSQAINDLCQKKSGSHGTTILFENNGEQFPLNGQVEAYLYRIVQELLNNCIKHSLALQVLISLTWSKPGLTLVVSDNGIGLPQFIKNLGRFGITGIFLRVQAIGATAKFNAPRKGTEFVLKLSTNNKPPV